MFRAQPYVAVEAAWPEQCPVPTEQEALLGAKKLYRKFRGKAWQGKWRITSGRRATGLAGGVFQVNPNRYGRLGWKSIVHLLSHYIARRLYPEAPDHGLAHSGLEREMIQYVISQGWLNGKLRRPEKVRAVINLVDLRQKRILESIGRWEAKQKRAKTALKKLYRQRNYYERKVV